jgi:hypothetical protein
MIRLALVRLEDVLFLVYKNDGCKSESRASEEADLSSRSQARTAGQLVREELLAARMISRDSGLVWKAPTLCDDFVRVA